ncbi:hypothetical protein Hanom_Chr08g00682301 [Helianthus anomalus]
MKINESAIGTHAPSRNFIREAEKYKASIVPKSTTKPIARKTLWCQHRTITRDVKHVVTNITVITAKPDQHVMKSIFNRR